MRVRFKLRLLAVCCCLSIFTFCPMSVSAEQVETVSLICISVDRLEPKTISGVNMYCYKQADEKSVTADPPIDLPTDSPIDDPSKPRVYRPYRLSLNDTLPI